MKKKLLSLALACAMILTLAVPAFAADKYVEHADGSASDQLTQSVTIATRTYVPTVKLTLPTMTDPTVILNPYKISFTADDSLVNGKQVKAASGQTNADQVKQVISPVYTIKNETNVKLNYTVAVTGSVEGGVSFSNDAVSLEEKNKKAHVALVVANKSVSALTNDTVENAQDILSVTGLSKADVEEVYLKNSEVKFTDPKTLSDASQEAGNSKANYLAFQFKGDLTRQPTPNSWTADDKIGAVITFTFTPESAQDFTVAAADKLTIGSTDLSQSDSNLATAAVSTAAITTLVPADGSWKVASTPNWGIYNAGAYGATLDSNNKVKLDATKLKAIAGTSGAAATKNDKIVLKFTDTENLPRTVEVPISFTITS
jgi:hypothetical protein